MNYRLFYINLFLKKLWTIPVKKIAFKPLMSVIFAIFLVTANQVLAQEDQLQEFREETLEGVVTEVLEEKQIEKEGVIQNYQILRISVTKGSLQGSTLEIENGIYSIANSQRYKPGDRLVITYTKDIDGEDLFMIVDFVRRDGLLYLFLLFVVLAVAIGRVWGATSILGMAFSFFIIFKFILPQIISGKDPVIAAVTGSVLIIPVTFSLSHGFKIKTLIAGIGTILTLVIIGLMANFFVNLTHLTGFSSEEAGFLQFELQNILNMKGILLAGIIIASLGVLDDITISQASIVFELKKANKNYGFGKLYNSAMNVGRDHIASLINTLVLVYTGVSLPLLLLFINSSRSFSEIINYEIIADEIVRTLVGSIGLMLAVPITTLLAAYFLKSSKVAKEV